MHSVAAHINPDAAPDRAVRWVVETQRRAMNALAATIDRLVTPNASAASTKGPRRLDDEADVAGEQSFSPLAQIVRRQLSSRVQDRLHGSGGWAFALWRWCGSGVSADRAYRRPDGQKSSKPPWGGSLAHIAFRSATIFVTRTSVPSCLCEAITQLNIRLAGVHR